MSTSECQEVGVRSRIGPLLYAVYGRVQNHHVRRLIRSLARRREGGQGRSETLRRIFADFHGVEIGLYSDGGCFNPFSFDAGTKIGRYCSIAETATGWGANHPMNSKSSSALFYNPVLGIAETDAIERTALEIGHDVWLGHNSVILSSVRSIGHGAVIGAGSVVNKDVPPYAVVVSHPARVVRYRFSESQTYRSRSCDTTPRSLDCA